jgi:N utilization substance protein A
MMQDPDEIYKLQGFTPKIMNEIASLIKFMGMLDQREKDRAAELEAEALESMVEEAEEEQEEVVAVEDEPFVDLTEVEPVIEEVETEPVQAEEFEDVSFDELFNQIRVEAPAVDYSDEDDNGDEMLGKKGKKKKKKRHVEIEYDPDNDITTVRKKRKRGGDEEWGW